MEDPRLIQNSQSSPGGRAASLVIVALLVIFLIVAGSASAATLKIAPASLKTATATVHYDKQLSATNGAGPYTYTVESGSLPEGLSLSPSGELSGTPQDAGTSTFTVGATDSSSPAQTVTRTYTLTVQLDLLPAKLPAMKANKTFLQPLTAAGGSGSYSYSLLAGTLPPGVAWYELSPTNEGLAGPVQQAGLYKFTLKVEDGAGHTGTRSYTWNVGLSLYPEEQWDVDMAFVGVPYAQGIGVEGGSGHYTYTTAGTLPPGTALAEGEYSEEEIKGTPTRSGLYRVAVTATDTETGRTVTTRLKIPVFGSPVPFELRHLEEAGGQPETDFVSLTPEGEAHGVISGAALVDVNETFEHGTFSYDVAGNQLRIVVAGVYSATCEPQAHTCTGTGPNGPVTFS